LNSRSSLTMAGNFGLLRFPDSTLLESDQGGVQVGYNRNLNPRDSLGISYGLNLVRYPDSTLPQKLNSHSVQVAYGRKVTGRLALQASGGPQFNQIDDPTRGQVTRVTWTARSGLIYRFGRSEMQMGYLHTVAVGAGVVSITTTDQVQGSVTTRLTRTIFGSFSGGYAHNANPQAPGSALNNVFDSEFVGASLNRPLGREATLFLNYSFQRQTTNVLSCGVGLCGNEMNRHIAGMGFEWRMRPLLIH